MLNKKDKQQIKKLLDKQYEICADIGEWLAKAEGSDYDNLLLAELDAGNAASWLSNIINPPKDVNDEMDK